MQIWPAIDLLNGQAVRLTKGSYENVKVYFNDPQEILAFFTSKGARHLHVVDLDGARDGKAVNFDTIRLLAHQAGCEIEVGGGIRDEKRIDAYLSMGVRYVILGTKAVQDPAFLEKMLQRYEDHIVVGVDTKNGMVATGGWLHTSDLSGPSFCKELERMGVSRIIYTNIAKDGMLQGTDLALYKELASSLKVPVTASGGITHLSEIEKLRQIGIGSCIIGKAIYEGVMDLSKALAFESR